MQKRDLRAQVSTNDSVETDSRLGFVELEVITHGVEGNVGRKRWIGFEAPSKQGEVNEKAKVNDQFSIDVWVTPVKASNGWYKVVAKLNLETRSGSASHKLGAGPSASSPNGDKGPHRRSIQTELQSLTKLATNSIGASGDLHGFHIEPRWVINLEKEGSQAS